ncbi:hypothetical protein KSC_056930 [Ktedonobacter sp. SOSP1-52]|uniref:hypothetical protein n=1 Tax=Ktedonobacter sp. SOSP1-52 TaxID=2778366 RepID=UPI001A210DA6|nr:hypothetical protein [Ktedonobacter sp. SOSP1-52]GHO66801.1 hypothetical protein KSC_056930 [Ktedonobacter sp. SOSP1-52]
MLRPYREHIADYQPTTPTRHVTRVPVSEIETHDPERGHDEIDEDALYETRISTSSRRYTDNQPAQAPTTASSQPEEHG